MLKVLTAEEVTRLVNAPPARTKRGKRDRAFLSILAYGGLRIAEVCALKVSDIEQDGEQMRLTFAGKGGRVRTVSLPLRAAKAVLAHKTGLRSTWLFKGRDGHLSPRRGHFLVTSWAKRAGLPDWVHPHSLRHTFATTLMRKTGNLFLVSRVLGHANVNTTASYYVAYDKSYADEAAAVWN